MFLAYTFRTAVFKKYNPDMNISTLRAGQNLQVILPYALHSKMKYISIPLFGRVNHIDSHSQNAARDSFNNRIYRENEITQIITETMYKDSDAIVWIPSIYMKSIFTKYLISLSENEQKEKIEYKKQAIKMYIAISKQFLKGITVMIKGKLKAYVKKKKY